MAVLATMLASPARSADTGLTPGPVQAANGALVAHTPLTNSGTITGSIVGTSLTINTGTQSGTDNPVDLNSVIGTSIGNSATHTGLDLIVPGIVDEGIASLIVESNTGSIVSSVSGYTFSVDIDGFQTGNASVDGNLIGANSTNNFADTLITATLASGDSSTTAGDTFFLDLGTPGGGVYTGQGTLALETVQANDGHGSAEVLGGNLTLHVDRDGTSGVIATGASIDDNEVTAAYRGNDANTAATVQDGGNPSFAGSAGVLSYQYNGADAHVGGGEAMNSGTFVEARIDSSAPDVGDAEFAGTLSVSGNEISASADGNSAVADGMAGNRILLEGAVSLAGPSTNQDNQVQFAPGALLVDAEADLVVNSVQQNVDAGTLASRTEDAVIRGAAESTDGAILRVSDNLISSATRGNAASSSIANESTAQSIAGTAAVSNLQTNFGGAIRATTIDSDITATIDNAVGDDVADNSTVSVSGNTIRSSAVANTSAQLIDLDAGDLAIGTAAANLSVAESGGGFVVNSDGGATINNVQVNVGAPVLARTRFSDILIDVDLFTTDPLLDSTLLVVANAQTAFGAGNVAENDLLLSGNALGTGAGINSGQINDETSEVGARFRGSAGIDVSWNVRGTDVRLSGNEQQAAAFGNSVDNLMSLDGNSVVIDPTLGGELGSSIDTALAATIAGFAIQNMQGQFGAVEARIRSDGSLLFVDVVHTIRTGATVGINGNDVSASAFANDAANELDLGVNDLSVSGLVDHANIAALSNGQYVGAPVSATINPDAEAILLTAGDDVFEVVTLTASDNAFEALAYGNRTTKNDLNVTGNSIVSSDDTDVHGFVSNGGPIDADGAFVVQSAQLNEDAPIEASVLSGDGLVRDVLIDLNRRVEDALVQADGNSFKANATSNSAASSLSIEADGLVATAAVQNYQESNGTVTATSGGRSSGIEIETGNGTTGPGNGRLILSSSLSISDNSRSATAIGNDGAASLDVAANNITAAGNNPTAAADNDSAEADLVVGNTQDASDSTITASAFGNLVIQDDGNTDVQSSALTIDGNSQSAAAIANKGANSLSLDATNAINGDDVGVDSALLSVQRGDGVMAVGADSTLAIQSPGQVSGSSVSLSDNVNAALAVINDVTNQSSVSVANLQGLNDAEAEVLTGAESTADSDHVLNSIQTAVGDGGSVSALALTSLGNADAGSTGMSSSTLAMDGNFTATEAAANRAVNSMSVGGSASNGASAVLASYQSSNAAVSANSTTTANASLTGDGVDGIADSTVSADGNRTTALARGNSAVNSLDYSGGTISPTNAVAGSSVLNGTGQTASANALVLNSQSNAGPVTASATFASSLALNALNGSNAASNSSISASGNVVSAAGYGNYAVNTLTVGGMNTGASAVVSSNQVNSGNVTVSAAANIGIAASGGPVSGTSFGITGNAVTATAIGNSVVTTLSN